VVNFLYLHLCLLDQRTSLAIVLEAIWQEVLAKELLSKRYFFKRYGYRAIRADNATFVAVLT
jgi:hypothetical protein